MSEFQHAPSALITGGTSGIGRGIALALSDAGANVIVTGVTDQEVQQFDAAGRNIRALKLDVTDEQQIDQIVSSLDQLEILVNCAGIILRDKQEHSPDQFSHVIDVNLTGTMRVCYACKPLLDKQGGSVVNMASMLTFFGSGVAPAYSASKGGVAQLTKSLAIAWAQDGIRVNAVAPGWIKTPMTQPLVDNQQRSNTILNRTPMGRWGSPADVAGAVVFLCSSSASFITGVVLPVDGGYSIS
ncbi:MAG: SDR family oxidoreductase [Planctomycetaceae bacterium]|nr:SDR family oxidoreductase [Planctomycetaceae bacterium]